MVSLKCYNIYLKRLKLLKDLKIMNVSRHRGHLQIKAHRRAGMNITLQVIPLGKSWAIKHFSCLFREGLLLWIKSP